MKFEIDTEKKEIKILEEIKFTDLVEFMKNYKDYKLIPDKTIEHIYNPIQINDYTYPYNPTNPNYPYITVS